MNSERNNSGEANAVPKPENPEATGVLLSRDLIFTTKITSTAAALGSRVHVASNEFSATSLIESSRPQVVFVDLTAGAMVAPEALARYRKQTGPGSQFVAFGPHVDADSLAAAQSAGCQVVLTRS